MIWARAATPRSPWGIWRPIGPLSSSTLGTSRMPTSTCLMYVCACGLLLGLNGHTSPHLCCARITIFPMPGDVLTCRTRQRRRRPTLTDPTTSGEAAGCTLPTVQLPRQQTTTSLSFHHSCYIYACLLVCRWDVCIYMLAFWSADGMRRLFNTKTYLPTFP